MNLGTGEMRRVRKTAGSRRSEACGARMNGQSLCSVSGEYDQQRADQASALLLLSMNISEQKLAPGTVDAYERGALSVPKRQQLALLQSRCLSLLA